jgi:hypothetical protein
MFTMTVKRRDEFFYRCCFSGTARKMAVDPLNAMCHQVKQPTRRHTMVRL